MVKKENLPDHYIIKRISVAFGTEEPSHCSFTGSPKQIIVVSQTTFFLFIIDIIKY